MSCFKPKWINKNMKKIVSEEIDKNEAESFY